MRKNIGRNKALAAKREARENARKPIRLKRRLSGEASKLRRVFEIAKMNKLMNQALQKRRTAEANGQVFENDFLTDLALAAKAQEAAEKSVE